MNKINDSCLAAGAGKTNPTVRSLTAHPMVYTTSNGKTKRMGEIVYVTSKTEIERRDISRFMSNFGPHQSKQELRQLRGRIIFTVDGFDRDADLFEIPDVREFYAMAHKCWPCWLFTACLASESLRVIALSVIPNLPVDRSRDNSRTCVAESELRAFFMDSLPATLFLNDRSGIPRDYGSQYLQAVASYLDLPKDCGRT